MGEQDKWHPDVYGEHDYKLGNRVKYKSKLDSFCIMYRYVCQSCRKRYSKRSAVLGLHHIVPRSKGGGDTDANLILLCAPCHDKIEDNLTKYSCRSTIEYAFARRKRPAKRRGKRRIILSQQSERASDWHEFVYGGKRNKLKDAY